METLKGGVPALRDQKKDSIFTSASLITTESWMEKDHDLEHGTERSTLAVVKLVCHLGMGHSAAFIILLRLAERVKISATRFLNCRDTNDKVAHKSFH